MGETVTIIMMLLILALLPVVLISWYVYWKDRRKEPTGLLALLFGLGVLSCGVTLALSEVVFRIFPFMDQSTNVMNIFEVMAYSFIGVALIEEFSKWVMVYFCGYNNKQYDEVYDGIVYAVFVSLGFAALENILYVLGNMSIGTAISRALLAVPGHACDAVFMGYYFSLAKMYKHQNNHKEEIKNLILGIVAPTIIHGFYDFCLFSGVGFLMILFFAFVIAVYIISVKKIKQLSTFSQNNSLKSSKNKNIPQRNNINNQNLNMNAKNSMNMNNNMGMNNSMVMNNNMGMNNNLVNQNQNNPANNLNYCKNCGNRFYGEYCSACGTRRS